MTEPTSPPPIEIRPAAEGDLPALGRLAGELVRLHHGWDAQRFFLPENVERGYQWWFGRELKEKDAILLAAVREGAVVGYAYGRIEERDWNMLLDAHAALHDILVDDAVRGHGVAERLLEAFVAAAKERGAPRMVLSTAFSNTRAQAFFEKHGFRRTMVEMTREL